MTGTVFPHDGAATEMLKCEFISPEPGTGSYQNPSGNLELVGPKYQKSQRPGEGKSMKGSYTPHYTLTSSSPQPGVCLHYLRAMNQRIQGNRSNNRFSAKMEGV